MIITFCGTPGSGKSTVAPVIAEKLGYKRIYIGGLRRELAKKRGVTIDEFNKIGETDPSTDMEADEVMRKIVYEQDNLVIETRTAAGLFRKWGIEKDSIHLLLKCSVEEGAKRIYEQKKKEGIEKRNEDMPPNIEAQTEELKKRIKSDSLRYTKHYGFDSYDETLYDVVIDTTTLTQEQAIEAVFDAVKKKAKEKFGKEI